MALLALFVELILSEEAIDSFFCRMCMNQILMEGRFDYIPADSSARGRCI